MSGSIDMIFVNRQLSHKAKGTGQDDADEAARRRRELARGMLGSP